MLTESDARKLNAELGKLQADVELWARLLPILTRPIATDFAGRLFRALATIAENLPVAGANQPETASNGPKTASKHYLDLHKNPNRGD